MDKTNDIKNEEFNKHFLQLVIGLQTGAWMALGKTMNPVTKEINADLNLARDTIDTLLMLKEKTSGNLTHIEKGLLENAMQDLELNFIEVAKKAEEKSKKESKKSDKVKEEDKEKKVTTEKERKGKVASKEGNT